MDSIWFSCPALVCWGVTFSDEVYSGLQILNLDDNIVSSIYKLDISVKRIYKNLKSCMNMSSDTSNLKIIIPVLWFQIFTLLKLNNSLLTTRSCCEVVVFEDFHYCGLDDDLPCLLAQFPDSWKLPLLASLLPIDFYSNRILTKNTLCCILF